MKKIVLTSLSIAVLTACGGGGSSSDNKKSTDNLKNENGKLEIVSSSTSVDENSVIVKRENKPYTVAKSINEIGSDELNIFSDYHERIDNLSVVSENAFISSTYIGDYQYQNMITFSKDENQTTYKLEENNASIEYYDAKQVGESVVILGTSQFYYVKDGKKTAIKTEKLPSTFETNGKQIAFVTDNKNVTVMTTDGKKSKTYKGDYAKILHMDDDNIFITADYLFDCHPIDAGLIEDFDGDYKTKNCDLNPSDSDENSLYSQSYNMIPVIKLNIYTGFSEPWVWISWDVDVEPNEIESKNGYLIFNDLIQDVRYQNANSINTYKEYDGVNIPLVELKSYCKNTGKRTIYSSYVGIINESDNKIYCIENSFEKDKGVTSESPTNYYHSGVYLTESYLNHDNNYVNDGSREIDLRRLSGISESNAYNFVVSDGYLYFSHDKNQYTFEMEKNTLTKKPIDESIRFIQPMKKNTYIKQKSGY